MKEMLYQMSGKVNIHTSQDTASNFALVLKFFTLIKH